MFDSSKIDAGFPFCFSKTPGGNFFATIGCRRLTMMIAATIMTSTTRKNPIKPGTNQRRLVFEEFAAFLSMVCGMVKNSSDRGDRTSILFKAFRIELNLIILYPKSVILRIISQTGTTIRNHIKIWKFIRAWNHCSLLSRGISNEPLDLYSMIFVRGPTKPSASMPYWVCISLMALRVRIS